MLMTCLYFSFFHKRLENYPRKMVLRFNFYCRTTRPQLVSAPVIGHLCQPTQHLGPKTYDKETSRGRGIERAGCGLEQVVPQFVVELGPGGAGFIPGTLAAQLAESVSQCRRHFARSLRIRTARAPPGRRL